MLGWATWKKKWNIYDKNIKFWPKLKRSKIWNSDFLTKEERKYWSVIFDACYNNKIDSWAYPWTLSLWKKKQLTITPSKNLVENIGLKSSRKRTIFRNKIYKKKFLNMKSLKLNKNLRMDNQADNYVFKNHFRGNEKILFWKILKVFNKKII